MTLNSKHQLLVLSPSTPISSCTQEVSQLHLTRFFLCYLSVCLAVWPKTEHESVMTVRIILLMTQSRSTISSTRHWSRQAKGASLLISADNRGDTLLCTSLNVAMRGWASAWDLFKPFSYNTRDWWLWSSFQVRSAPNAHARPRRMETNWLKFSNHLHIPRSGAPPPSYITRLFTSSHQRAAC